jgi:hypothetical protein
MKSPPAASIRLGASWWYRCMVLLTAALLIAACAVFYWASGLFDAKNGVFQSLRGVLVTTAASVAIALALWDAWRPRFGALHYAGGDWVLALGDVEYQGTLRPVLDLQYYLLVTFVPSTNGSDPRDNSDTLQLHNKQQQWLHLESRHARHSGLLDGQAGTAPARSALALPSWQALRRAVHAQAMPTGSLAHEQT